MISICFCFLHLIAIRQAQRTLGEEDGLEGYRGPDHRGMCGLN